MLTLYTILAIVGTGLALLAAFTGHGDQETHIGHELEPDLHHEIYADQHPEGLWHWMPFFSLRFWTFFAACFGLIGLGLTKASGMQEPTVGILAGTFGFLAGFGISLLYKAAMKVVESNSNASEEDLIGKEVKVLVAVRQGVPGRVRGIVKGEILDVMAELEGFDAIEAGQPAIVVGFERDMARVMPCNLALEETVDQKG